jgi:hypothetical protein
MSDCNVVPHHVIVFGGLRFWVTHRRRDYSTFDYEWSRDFAGIELLDQAQKFGEYCSREEIFADLKPFQLPRRVVAGPGDRSSRLRSRWSESAARA